ncbi:substrate-binding and VWA domain-containing protein [Serratia sp. DD3]|uniref:substrate-binding and VWA domain-containing protein n=1 Tax=Serratia sp. DD3 TaxID=1410619 RepID=UPI0003C4EDA3|nr:substrate-binding and VWA domain-containing protein [Serratia sp. DD3]KEY60340.1 marine proteobacterial sortase target protein [Serratia sp. DD3]
MKNIFALLCTLVVLLTGCKGEDSEDALASNNNIVLSVLAGSELKDIEPLLPDIAKATGVKLQMHYVGTLDAIEKLQAGENYDLAWLASNRYAMLVPQVKARIVASERTMLTPVVLGIKEKKAKALGWENNPHITWKDIAQAADKGKFTFGMTSPTSSNTGFSGLLGLAAALSGKGDALEEKDIDTKQLSAFFKAQRLTSGSSGWLADAYLQDQDKVDGIINYASTLQLLNRNLELKQKLVLIYPQDGIVTADYPIMLLNAAKRDAYDKLVAYLHGSEFQKRMTESTLRQPVNPDVVSASEVPKQTPVELSFPAKREVVDTILAAFDNELRLPTDSTFVLDTSGSMSGERITELKKALLSLSGADDSISGRFSRFRNREQIYLLPFSDIFAAPEAFAMGNTPQSHQRALTTLNKRINELQAGGGTAIFSSTQQAYIEAAQRRHQDPGRFYSIVVMTDGENNQGIDVGGFINWYQQLAEADKGIKIFPVLFGEASPEELQQLAKVTGGKVFDSRKNSLQQIFKEIRGYQ